MKPILLLLPILLFSTCTEAPERTCTPDFFQEYANTPILSSLKMYPQHFTENGEDRCGMYIDFKFWLGPDSGKKQIFKGLLVSHGDSVLYRRDGDSTFCKLFDFSFVSPKDSSNNTSTIPWKDSTRTMVVTDNNYQISTNSSILEYKIQGLGLFDVTETLTLYVSRDFGIIGAYVSLPPYSDKYNQQIIVAYMGDIMLYNLRIGKDFELQNNYGYE